MIHKFLFSLLLFLCLNFDSLSRVTADFSSEEVQKIRQIMHQMTSILEGNHQEMLEIEEVLARAGTPLRKARLKERLKDKLASFKDRLKDLRKIRSGFVTLPRFKEFIIVVDDRLKVMEDNLVLLEQIYFPAVLKPAKGPPDDYPTFINPGDPRYELDEDQEKLASAIQQTRNLQELRRGPKGAQKDFSSFVSTLDQNLKSEEKPLREVVPVLGRTTLDQFHEQLKSSRTADLNYSWDENPNAREFREFFQEVEQLHKPPTESKVIVTGFPRKSGKPDGARSQKTFQDLVQRMQDESTTYERKQEVHKVAGSQKSIEGMNSFLNETRLDGHKLGEKDFNAFLEEMEPLKSEIVLSYQKGIVKKPRPLQYEFLQRALVPHQDRAGVFFERLKHRRVFEQKPRTEENGLSRLSKKLEALSLSKARKYDPETDSFTRNIRIDPLTQSKKYDPLVTGPLPGDFFPEEVVRKTGNVAWVNRAMTFLEKLRDYQISHDAAERPEGVEAADFGKFLNELSPVPDEVVRSYTKALLGKDPSLQDVKPVEEELPEIVEIKPSTVEWIGRELEFLERLRTRTVIQEKKEYRQEVVQSYLQGLEVRVSKLGEPKFFKEMNNSSREYLAHARPAVEGPKFKAMDKEEITEYDPVLKGPDQIDLQGKMTLVPVTIQLLDDDRAAYRDVELEFQLYLPEKDPLIQGKILESGARHPHIALRTTNEAGEATVHLLMELQGREVQIGREILQDNQKVLCRIFVETSQL